MLHSLDGTKLMMRTLNSEEIMEVSLNFCLLISLL